MSLANLQTDATIENETDSIGGNGPWASGAYPGTITMAYLDTSAGGAKSITIHMKDSKGRELRTTEWVVSGNAKGNKNYYEKDGVKNYLPGFNNINSLCLLATGKEVGQLETEDKIVSLYDFQARAEKPRTVPVFVDLIGTEIIAGVLLQTVDKNVKQDDGSYAPSGETRDENVVNKYFRAKDKMTTAEIRAQAEVPEFFNKWEKDKTGIVVNKVSKTGAGTKATPSKAFAGTPTPAAKPQTSLFAA
jgi:hypothetical protein